MSVQYDPDVVRAVKTALSKVWYKHWREGKTELRASQVIDVIKSIRVDARVDESDLPDELLKLLKQAHQSKAERQTVKLYELIVALKAVFLTAEV